MRPRSFTLWPLWLSVSALPEYTPSSTPSPSCPSTAVLRYTSVTLRYQTGSSGVTQVSHRLLYPLSLLPQHRRAARCHTSVAPRCQRGNNGVTQVSHPLLQPLSLLPWHRRAALHKCHTKVSDRQQWCYTSVTPPPPAPLPPAPAPPCGVTQVSHQDVREAVSALQKCHTPSSSPSPSLPQHRRAALHKCHTKVSERQ
jgi:hypothetical protein